MRVSFLLLTVLLVSCSSLPPKTEAIHQALVTDAAIREATEQCVALGGDDRRLAQREQVNWWKRNGAYVLAADYGLLELNWETTPAKTEAQRAVLSMQILELIQKDASDLTSKWFGDYEESEDCQKVFKNVGKGKLDITKEKKQAEILKEIYQNRQDLSEDSESARSINSRYRKYGRSLFVVEKTLKATGCSSPKIALLRNSWPLEIYDAVCSQNDYVIVKCDWGRCEAKR